jgi:hypothetical protein
MIDWLGARKPLDVVLLMTLLVSLGAAATELVLIPLVSGIAHVKS